MTAEALGLLADAVRLPLGAYRTEHVAERVRRALEREGALDVPGLARLVRADTAARRRFRESVLVPVTGLFRDPHQFDLLAGELLPGLIADGRRLRVWSAGCADGSELASVALVLRSLGALERSYLLGSDIHEENIEVARRGAYPGLELPVPVRARLHWECRDLVRDGAPAGAWRLVLCRNVAIYFTPEAKLELHRTLAGSLGDGGVLLLGRSERISRPASLGLEPAGPHAYRKIA